MRLVEAVLGELLHQVKKLGGQVRVMSLVPGTVGEDGPLLRHFLSLFLAHGTTQQVGTTQRVAGDDLRNLHHLLLIHDHAIGGLQAITQVRMEVVDLLLTLLAQDEVIDHARAQRPGTVERQHRDDVLEPVGGQLAQQLFHAVALDLEDCRGVGIFQDLIGARVIEGER